MSRLVLERDAREATQRPEIQPRRRRRTRAQNERCALAGDETIEMHRRFDALLEVERTEDVEIAIRIDGAGEREFRLARANHLNRSRHSHERARASLVHCGAATKIEAVLRLRGK